MREILSVEENTTYFGPTALPEIYGTRITFRTVQGFTSWKFFRDVDAIKALALLMRHFERLDARNAKGRKRK